MSGKGNVVERDGIDVASGERGPDDVDSILVQLVCLAGRDYTRSDLPGGLTNRNIRVQAGDDDYVVRIASQNGGLLSIDRDNEYHNSVAAAGAGVGAPVVEYRPDLGVLVVGFVEAATLSTADLRSGAHLERIASACRQLHAGLRFRDDFDMFSLQPYYLSIVTENGYRLPDRYVDFMAYVERIRGALSARPAPTVPCNNDLLAENFLDDGERLWLIDYEYSGNNDPCFELGNIWSESGLELDQLAELVEHYFGEPRADKVARARLQGLMSKYGWTLWASIQDSVAEIEFDFWSWGMEKYERAVAEFESSGFDALLDAAAGR
ncbi:MAG: phosphotransferase [Acidimicrobiales bacterium]|jgi:thiamine kinase-like enzyme